MDKFLGQEYENLQDRERFLKDIAEKVESISYDKPIKPDEIEKLKEDIAEQTAKMIDAEEAKKLIDADYNKQIKECKEAIKKANDKWKRKSEYVTEVCYKVIDEKNGQVGYYNSEGMLAYERRARQDELQPRLFPLGAQKTGTDN